MLSSRELPWRIVELILAPCMPLFSSTSQELEALRARKERLAEIRAAELEEQSLAVSKARVVVELKVLSAQQKLRLRRASQEGEVLSSGAADAAAAVEAGCRASGTFGALEEEAALGSPLDEPTAVVPHGVMRRRVARIIENHRIAGAQHPGAAPDTARGGGGAAPLTSRGGAGPPLTARGGGSLRPPEATTAADRVRLPLSLAPRARIGADLGSARSAESDGASVARTEASGALSARGGALSARSGHSDDLRSAGAGADDDNMSATSLDSAALRRVARAFVPPPGTPAWVRARLGLQAFLSSGTFGLVMMTLIVLNTGVARGASSLAPLLSRCKSPPSPSPSQ